MNLLYFAWVRERIGLDEERVAPPAEVATVGALIAWLRARGGGYGHALEDRAAIRVAVNQAFVGDEAAVAAGDEVAIFPPVTGG